MTPFLRIARNLVSSLVRPKLPRMQLAEEQVRDLMTSRTAAANLAKRLVETLRTYPHFVILKRTSIIGDGALIVRLVETIAKTPPLKAGDRRKAEITRVDINTEKATETRLTTRYSRTNQPMALHTDDSFNLEPRELVVFDFVRADTHGGDTLLAAVEDVVAALEDEVIGILKQPAFPFGRGDHPVLWEQNGKPNIRYSRTQLDKMRESEHRLTERDLAAMEALDAVLCRKDVLYQFHAEAGETIFLDNTKVLHGRTGFSEDSDRLMYRTRMHVGCLG